VRVIVLAAKGPVFCAGMDLGEMQTRAGGPDPRAEWQRDSEVYGEALTRLYGMGVPTVAVVQGPAVAGGVGLVAACDLVVASTEASFALPEPQRGITAAMVTPLLIQRVGPGAAARLLLSGERWSAEDAHRAGFCHALAAQEMLAARAETLVANVLAGSPSALAITKRHLGEMSADQMAARIRRSMDVSAEARATPDAREGLAAFLERRKPAWQPE
jgi:methylglutaconyl-CoA hydratase